MKNRVNRRSLLWRGAVLAVVVATAFLASPARSASAATATAVSAGRYHTCALTAAGGLKCWGLNDYGQLGDGTTTDRSSLVDVTGLTSGVVAVSAGGYHTCSVTTAGGLKCWGRNSSGQLGDGTYIHRLTPLDVTGLTGGVAAVSAGFVHTCAVTTAGGLKCWGDGFGSAPVDVSGLSVGVSTVSAGRHHTCAVTTAGGVKCWGANSNGQLGDGTTTIRAPPVDTSGLSSGVSTVSAGQSYTCAVITAGGLKCWGSNHYGKLGDGTATDRSTQVDVTGLTSGVAAVSTGSYHTCAVTTTGGLKCWGSNRYGQLGDGTATDRSTQVDVTGLTSGVAAVSTGSFHTCAVTTTGGLKCWGQNRYGQLGDGTTSIRSTPVDVSGLSARVAAVSAGLDHTCAPTTTGGLKCWGLNRYGQLGDGTTSTRATPVDVSGLSTGVAAASARGSHTCALTIEGGLKCWGLNSSGQLGNGATTDRRTPVDVSGLSTGVAAISAGGSYSCAMTAANGVKCWGSSIFGRLGDGTTGYRPTPVDVIGFVVAAAPIPGVSQWGLIALAGLMAALLVWQRRSFTTGRTRPRSLQR